uniref:Uncharacterized protein n=1 Tax=viral metagenome TaxID=1070528 RepID=A0A6M3Y536_9ZZZZ
MADPRYWRLKCKSCGLNVPCIIVDGFSFDSDGMLKLNGCCRFCLKKRELTHTSEEILADMKYHAQQVLKEKDPDNFADFNEWEGELEDEGE